jgi:type II secretory pathway pseudopilin PulG
MSLVEVMVAIVIFSFAALAVLTMTSGAFNANSHSEAIDIASNLARRQMETILSKDFADVVDRTGDGVNGLQDTSHHDPGNPTNPGIADYSETLDDTSGLGLKRNYDVYWNIAADTPESWAKTVSVIVAWNGKTGARTVTYQTIWTE